MRTHQLIEQQHQLLMQSAVLRLQFQKQVQIVVRPLALVDKVQNGLNWLRQHPQWPIATITLLIVVRPRQSFKWGGRLWWAWNFYRNLQLNLSTMNAPMQRR